MIDRWIIVGAAHYAVTAVLLKLFGLALPCCLTGWYTDLANTFLYLCVARFTFVLTKRWYLNERLPPENRAVFITGCDTGFGHNAAKFLDSNGFPVFAGCLNPSGNGALELKRSCSKRLQIVEIDVTKDSSVKKAVEFVKDNLGTSELWAIVNNAGILKGFEVELTDMQYFKESLEVNTFGPVRVTKAFLPLLRQSRGRIVNITSMGGRLPLPYCTPYIMSKYAAVAFTECLRTEMNAWGIRVISIEPEFFKTRIADGIKTVMDEMFEKVDPDVKDDYGEKYMKNFKLYTQLVNGLFADSLDPVLDSIDKAVSLKYPDSVYQPCRNIFSQMFYYGAQHVPRPVVDNFFKLFMIISGFPHPRTRIADGIKHVMDEMFEKIDPDVRDDYGEKYLKNFKLYTDMANDVLAENLHPVLDSIDKAVGLKYPDSVYQPCRNIFSQFFYYTAQHVPRAVLDNFYKLFRIISGFPSPREAENYL